MLLRGPLLLLIFFCIEVRALDPARDIYQYTCRTWTRQNGLPANAVYAIRQTPDGYLWLGSSAGLVRFDGTDFKLFDMAGDPKLRSTVVASLSNSRRGGLWFAMEHGAFGYCDGRITSLLGREEWGGVDLNVHSIFENGNGDLWIASEILAARLTPGGRFETVLTTNGIGTGRYDVTAVYQDSQQRVWFGTSMRGIYCWQHGVLTPFPDHTLDTFVIRAFAEDKKGQLWIATDWGLVCYDAALHKKPLPFPWYPTRALLVDRHGVVWAGTLGGGLARFINDEPTLLRQTDGLADDFVTALAEDEEGSLWVGTRNGLSQLSDVKIPTLGRNEGLTADVNVAVCASRKGGFWLATSHGFAHYDGAVQSYTNVELTNPYLNNIFEAKNGDLYLINGSMDLQICSGSKIVATYPNKLWPAAMVEDDRGVIVSVADKLFRIGTNYFTPYVFTNVENWPLRWIFRLANSRDGSIWVAGGDGICRVKDGGWKLWKTGTAANPSRADWICEDSDGIAWAGLETGIARIKDGQMRIISRADGLFDDIIYSIVPDDRGNLWVDSSRGFFSVQRQVLNDFADGKLARVTCTGYTGLDVVKSAEKFQQQPSSGCKTADGRVWFPTTQGVAMIEPGRITPNLVPPNIHIQGVRANGRDVNADGAVILRPGLGDLEFDYAGVSFIAPQKIQYRYKLNGRDEHWVHAGPRRAAFYTNLKPGKYQFEVQACNEDGVWNETSATFAVQLLPHFYERAWFIVLVSGLMAAALLGIYFWRLRHLMRKQQQLQDARDLLEARVAARTVELRNEIEERKRAQSRTEELQEQLLRASRQAGQAEVASNVLHNVGNVLNSVNVSATLIGNRLQNLRLGNLSKVADLMKSHAGDLSDFLGSSKGRQVPVYMEELAVYLTQEQQDLLREMKGLHQNIDHIHKIIAVQQTYAKVAGLIEKVALEELVEIALRLNLGSFQRHSVTVERHYEKIPGVTMDKHKVLQVFVNLLKNAKDACDERGGADKKIVIRIARAGPDRVVMEISDNGIGIARENLTRIFSHGFTTRKDGHGFGLHSAALAAREMGGSLSAHSDGIGRGATFTLELPMQCDGNNSVQNAGSQPEAGGGAS